MQAVAFWAQSRHAALRTLKHSTTASTLEARISVDLHACLPQGLPSPAKILMLRMLLRKPSWFHLNSLKYADVPDIHAAADQLHAAGLVCFCNDSSADVKGLVSRCCSQTLKQALQQLLPPLHPMRNGARSKAELAQACQVGPKLGATGGKE